MKQSIGSIIYQAINENKWLDITYGGDKESATHFWFSINDIDFEQDKLYGDIFNFFKSTDCITDPKPISRAKILSAKLVEGSYYLLPQKLVRKIEANKDKYSWLDVDTFDNNILLYLSECYKYDNDPFIDDAKTIGGIDYSELFKQKVYRLTQEQFQTILDSVMYMNSYEAERSLRYRSLAFNIYSIDISGHRYVVAYRDLHLDFKNKTLKMSDKSLINKAFLIGDKRHTLGNYLTIDPDEFCDTFDANIKKYVEMMESSFRDGERSDTQPAIFMLQRSVQTGVEEAFNAIYLMSKEKKMTQPIKAFFGINSSRSGTSKEPYIVVFNKQITNIDQVRVVYNSMINHITYVQGPPGTGKTETIFNVLLSAYANEKTCLICSNNNNPIENIFSKMTSSFKRKNGYTEKFDDVLFPIIRIGNVEENKKTLLRLKDILNFIDKKSAVRVNGSLTINSKDKSLSRYNDLRKVLINYEQRQEIESIIQMLQNWKEINHSATIANEIDRQIEKQKQKLDSIGLVSDKMVTDNIVSSDTNSAFMDYLYYSSMETLRRLVNKSFNELHDIILNDNIDEAVYQFTAYLKNDDNLRRLITLFPFVVTTNISAAKLGSAKQHFDLCIMDEAGQCNMATALIPIIRGTDLLLVGDINQLQPVTVLEKELNDKLMMKYQVNPQYNYLKNSILNIMQIKDSTSKRIFLRYHYRCGQKIAGFANERFYGGKLVLANELPGELKYIEVENKPDPNLRNAYVKEATEIAKIIKDNNYTDVGIITPFVNQAALINQCLRKQGILNVKAGTIHTLQGAERNVIIMSSAISLKTSKKTMEWLENNHELINVGITRAKKTFVFVGDKAAIDVLSKSKDSDLKSLSDYVYSNGDIKVAPSEIMINTNFSNDSQAEKDFFETVRPYFQYRNNKYDIKRNVPVRETLPKISENDMQIIGQKEFDVVIRVKSIFRNYTPIIVFEIDGGEHIGSGRVAKRDREKELICKKYGIKLIRIPNNKVKDYEMIMSLFEVLSGESEDLRISLFDDEEAKA